MYVRILCVGVYLTRLQAAEVATMTACAHPPTNGCSLTPSRAVTSLSTSLSTPLAASSQLVRNGSFVSLETTILL
jgi:hypothetical protein